jgi:hypothetical protein
MRRLLFWLGKVLAPKSAQASIFLRNTGTVLPTTPLTSCGLKRLKGQRIAGDGMSPDEAVPIANQIAECSKPRASIPTRAFSASTRTESFCGVGRHVHDPDIAVVLSPREIEGTTVGGKIVTDVASPTLELRESRDVAVA